MKLICLDTCTRALSVAAMEDEVLLGERLQYAQVNHSVLLMPMLSELMETLGWDAKDVDVWAAVSGPGSFTGVRIGVSSVRALAHGWKRPVVSVGTLETLAMQFCGASALVVPLLDARRRQVYAAAYDVHTGAQIKCICAPCAMELDAFVAALPEGEKIFVGDGAQAHRESLSALPGAVVAPAYLQWPRAGVAAGIAWQKALAGDTLAYDALEPVYLRESQAQQSLRAREMQG